MRYVLCQEQVGLREEILCQEQVGLRDEILCQEHQEQVGLRDDRWGFSKKLGTQTEDPLSGQEEF